MNLFEYVKLSNERQVHEIMHAKEQWQKTPIGKTRGLSLSIASKATLD
jgi:hypothetical protein